MQSHASNHVGGFEDEYFAYTFTGKVKQRLHVHTKGNDSIAETYAYDYGSPVTNPTERLLSVKHKLNEGAEVIFAEYGYDEIGRVKTKKLATETSTYGYNVRSWMTQISGLKFNQTLAYNTTVNGVEPVEALYGGNISAMKWKSGNQAVERGYKFIHDKPGRLIEARYDEGANFTDNLGRYDEFPGYDKMGNITSMERHGRRDNDYGWIDNLTYTYTGNKLTRVTDAAPPVSNENLFYFVDRVDMPVEYEYDANGNLTKDLNRNISLITYNALNLPHVITFNDGRSITYSYDGAGSKLSVAYNLGSGAFSKMEYADNKVYINGTLDKLLTEEGYVSLDGPKTYHYFLKDHQGNNRVVIDQSGPVKEVNHYYPFGGLFGEGMQASNQPYRYNGKEFDRRLGLNMYDYGVRYYDAAVGRWFNVDPLAEEYYSWSSYSYVGNNSIIYIDPKGMFRTKFGAWLYKLFNGGDAILRDIEGEYFVSRRGEYRGNEPGITVKRTFDWEGRTEGKDLKAQSTKNVDISGVAVATTLSGELLKTGSTASQIDSTISSVGSLALGGGIIMLFTSYTPAPTNYLPPPKDLPGYPNAERVPNKGRARWKTKDGDILEWDSQHGEVEIYDKQGKHKGSSKPDGTGKKPRVEGRTTKK